MTFQRPLTCSTTSFESPRTSTRFAPSECAFSSPEVQGVVLGRVVRPVGVGPRDREHLAVVKLDDGGGDGRPGGLAAAVEVDAGLHTHSPLVPSWAYPHTTAPATCPSSRSPDARPPSRVRLGCARPCGQPQVLREPGATVACAVLTIARLQPSVGSSFPGLAHCWRISASIALSASRQPPGRSAGFRSTPLQLSVPEGCRSG